MTGIVKICICGGGGLGHTCAAVLSSHDGVEVMLYTQHPEQWNHHFVVDDSNGKQYQGRLTKISNQAENVIPHADIVLLCLPAYLVEKTLTTIKPHLSSSTIVGSVVGNTGFFLFAHEIFSDKPVGLFAFQRVPFISRVAEYGKKALLLGYKKDLLIATENISQKQDFCNQISKLFCTPTSLVDSFYEVTLSNSNPILHTGRLYAMWRNWDGKQYANIPLFYNDWTNETSEIIIQMDKEFFGLLNKLNVSTLHLPTLLEYYEVNDAASLTQKIKSIPAFANILSPMKPLSDGWIPDFDSRYFTEDFPFGLRFIYELAHKYDVDCPIIDKVYNWGIGKIK